ATHAGGEIAPGTADHDDGAAGHVFAAVVAGAFDDGGGAGITDAEALAGDAAKVRFAGDRPVHHRIPDDDVVFGCRGRLRVGIDDHSAARETLADVVVGRTLQLEGHATGEKRSKTLARSAGERNVQRVLGQAFMPIAAGDRAREHRTDRAVRVADPIFEAHRLLVLDRRCSVGDQAMVQGAFLTLFLLHAVVLRY